MVIEIKRPEIEALIKERLHSGAFDSVEDVLLDALESQREREMWLLENKETIQARIDQGIAQLDRGECVSEDDLRADHEADRAAWLNRNKT